VRLLIIYNFCFFKGKPGIDFILRLDHLKNDMRTLECITGLKKTHNTIPEAGKNPSICHANAFSADANALQPEDVVRAVDTLNSKGHRQFYDTDTKKIIEDLFKTDIEKFNFKF